MRRLLPFVALSLAACGGSGWTPTNAQRALQVGAEFTQDADEELASIVAARVTACDAEHQTREDFEECVEPYRPIRYGVALTRGTLRLGQAVVDGWRTGANEGASAWLPIAACVGHGLGIVAAAIRVLELDVPGVVDDIVGWVDTFGHLVASACPTQVMEDALRVE